MTNKILFVATSHGTIGKTNEPNGMLFSEMAHPYKILKDSGYEIAFASPRGGQIPYYGLEDDDPVVTALKQDKQLLDQLAHSLPPQRLKLDDYDAIYFPGGHGVMWDFPDNKELASIITAMYEQGKVVAAVCHGPAVLVNVRLSNGKYLVAGKNVTGFTNEEEKDAELEKVVPFLLESKLIERGGKYTKAPQWQPHVVVDGTLVTGQNPASAKGVGEAMYTLLQSS